MVEYIVSSKKRWEIQVFRKLDMPGYAAGPLYIFAIETQCRDALYVAYM